MIYLCVLNQSVTPADFDGGPVQCQNLDCLSPLEPPYHSARLCLPGGELETVLCSNCMPQPTDGVFPQIWLQVVDPELGPGQQKRPPRWRTRDLVRSGCPICPRHRRPRPRRHRGSGEASGR